LICEFAPVLTPALLVNAFQFRDLYRWKYCPNSSSSRGVLTRCRSVENRRSVIIRWHSECTVPTYICVRSYGVPVRFVTVPSNACNPSRSCSAAFSVNVDRKISLGSTWWNTIRFSVRHNSTRVFPDPGPAVRYSGPSACRIARSCALLGLNLAAFHKSSIDRASSAI